MEDKKEVEIVWLLATRVKDMKPILQHQWKESWSGCLQALQALKGYHWTLTAPPS